MSLGQFSNLAERLVGQEMFFILDRAKQIEEAGGKVRHLELGDPGLIADATIIKHTYDFLRRGYYHYTSSSGEESLKKAISALIKNNLNKLTESNIKSPVKYTLLVMPSSRKLSTDFKVGHAKIVDRWSATILFCSSGILRSNDRSPASI